MISALNCAISKSPCSFSLNPDVACRLLDEKPDGTQLAEYFNRDTNTFRLILIEYGKEIEIEHPYGKVEAFSERVDLNTIKFDLQNPQKLVVNGQSFIIVKKEESY
ncbi:MAG: hypothetical protein IPN69_18865 [Acidobacteria bacterium]|nr:hypothetical protein [Acidobacteriota bacterium]